MPAQEPAPSAFRPIGHRAQRGQKASTVGGELARPTPGRVRRRRLLGALFGRNRPTSPEMRKQLPNPPPVRRARTEPRPDAAPRRMLSSSQVDRWAGTGTWAGSLHTANSPSLDRFATTATTNRFTNPPLPSPSPPPTFLPSIADRFASPLSHSGSDRYSHSRSSPYTSSDRERHVSVDRERIASVDRFASPLLSSNGTGTAADRLSTPVLPSDRFAGPVRCPSLGSFSTTTTPKGESPPQRSTTYNTFESSPSLRQSSWATRGQRSAFDSLPSLAQQPELPAALPSTRMTPPSGSAVRAPSDRVTPSPECHGRCCNRRTRFFRRSRSPCPHTHPHAHARVMQADECYRAGFYAGVLASVEAKDCDLASRHLSWDATQRQNSHSSTGDKLSRMLSGPKRRATEHFRTRRWAATGRFLGTPYLDDTFSISMMTKASDNSDRY